jgi:adenylate cyclase class 1
VQGTSVTWIVRGETPKRPGVKGGYEEIRRDKSLVRLITWLTANQVYTGTMHMYGANLEFPVSMPEVQALHDALLSFFPPESVFNPDIQEFLRQERVVRALIILNFTVAREEKTLREAAVVWATNWGELYCLPASDQVRLLKQSPGQFLRTNIPHPAGPEADIRAHIPARSMCPRIHVNLLMGDA